MVKNYFSLLILMFSFILITSSCSDDIIVSDPNESSENCLFDNENSTVNHFLFEGYQDFGFSSAVRAKDGNILICGQTDVSDERRAIVIKTTEQGGLIWKKEVGAARTRANLIVQDEEKNIYIAGPNIGFFSVLKLSSNGDSIWHQEFEQHDGRSIHLFQDSIIIISFWNGSDFIKLNTNGITAQSINVENLNSQIYSSTLLHDNKLLVNSNFNGEYYQTIINSNGEISSQFEFGNKHNLGKYTIELEDESLLTVGDIRENQDAKDFLWLVKSSRNGEILWEKQFGNPNVSYSVTKVIENNDKTFLAIGSIYKQSGFNAFTFHISENGDSLRATYFLEQGVHTFSSVIKTEFDRNILIGRNQTNIYLMEVANAGN